MASTSPTQRLRTKTSDLTDFFRTAGQGSSQPRPGTSNATLEVPSADEHGAKKKITRIPLFGRSRKKSNQSSTSSPFASVLVPRESNDASEQPTRATSSDRLSLRPHTSVGNPSSSTATITSKESTKSFGSKLAAHFGHSRRSATATQPPLPTPPVPVPPAALSPFPPSKHSGDSESGSSAGSKRRSTTPRPRITVTSDNLEVQSTSTRPTSKSSRASSRTTINARPTNSDELDTTPSSSTTTSNPRNRSPEPLAYRRGQTPASAIAAAHRKNSSIGGDKPPSTSSRRTSSRQNSDSEKGQDGSGASTPRDVDTVDLSSRQERTPTPPEKDRESSSRVSSRRPSLATTSSHGSESPSSTMIRSSRMKPPTASRSRPPSMPLPLPPTPPTPTTPPPEPPVPLRFLPRSQPPNSPLPRPPSPRSEDPPSPRSLIRPRAHTIGATTPNVNIPALSSKAPQFQRSTLTGPVDVDSLDVDTASIEQLREALKERNQRHKDITAYVLKLREDHAAQVAGLEKKIASLEREGARRDKEIKGLTWIINNGETPQGGAKIVPNGTVTSLRLPPPSSFVDVDSDGKRVSRKPSYQSDSGAESHAESIIASGSGSESVSSVRHKRFRKLYSFTEATASTLGRGVSSSRRSSIVPPSSDSGHPTSDHPAPHSKRSSQLSSGGPSPSSSTSSLLPPSPSITMSSLTAIPEGTSSLKPVAATRYDSGSEHQYDDRRALRASHRISTSSMASSSTAASSAYSAPVIKRSRPPSIAQVLEKSPNLDDMLEKLRPFA